MSNPIKPAWCPKCAGRIDAATGVDGTTGETGRWMPTPGAWAMCVHCSALLRYDDTLTPKLGTREELGVFAAMHPTEYHFMRLAQDFNLVRLAAEKGRPQG